MRQNSNLAKINESKTEFESSEKNRSQSNNLNRNSIVILSDSGIKIKDVDDSTSLINKFSNKGNRSNSNSSKKGKGNDCRNQGKVLGLFGRKYNVIY